MKKRTVAALAATTLGLTLVGVGAAAAADGNAPSWAPQFGQHQTLGNGLGNGAGNGPGNGLGTGDPTTCPYYDGTGTGDMVQERTRTKAQDQSQLKIQSQLQDKSQIQQQNRDRIHRVS